MTRDVLALLVLVLAGCATPVQAQVSAPLRVIVQDEGAAQGTARTVNCTGSGVTCSVSGTVWTLNGAAGGGGGANVVSVSLDFGTALSPIQTVTVTGQTWVAGSSLIVCQPQATTADGQVLENYFVTPFHPTVSNLVAGTGFDVTVLNPTSAAGIYRFSCTGA